MTNIIGTIGPSSIQIDVLKRLRSLGLDSFRINLSHCNKDLLDDYYSQFKLAQVKPSLDTQGAQIRISRLKNKKFKHWETISIGLSIANESTCDIGINHREFFDQIDIGDEVKIDFGGLIVTITNVDKARAVAEARVLHVGEVELNKALDITNKTIHLPTFTDFDIECIGNSRKHDIQEIFVSFCKTKDCILSLKKMLIESGWQEGKLPRIIAKIESRQGLLNLIEIASVSDAILVDRGDLSREIKISLIPGIVENIIATCIKHEIPCYIATNVLDSMMKEKLPSRAEISDIYNLLFRGVRICFVAEAAIGDHPIESVEVIKYMSSVFFHQKTTTGITPSPKEIVPGTNEPLLSWL